MMLYEGRISAVQNGRLTDPPGYRYLILKREPGRIAGHPEYEHFVLLRLSHLILNVGIVAAILTVTMWLGLTEARPPYSRIYWAIIALTPMSGSVWALRSWLKTED